MCIRDRYNDTTWRYYTILNFCEFCRIFYVGFRKKSRRRARPIVDRGWILRNSLYISDEIGSCVPKNDFFQKSWANYDAPAVQILPVCSRIGKNLSFSKEVHGCGWYGCHIWISLIFLIDLDILFVKFWFTDLQIWIIQY